ncbi:hypothetical protein XA26_37290 [Mycolicibacterium fortuitum]|uniref:Uncharacterized protein n=1 Tax=Mycolicibacterium fortuitum TaxID=1766 RepID=A0A0N9Y893_MYCFO|nr:hypothetical protein XA26_37290 [Mycolicibacterium fortuitum]
MLNAWSEAEHAMKFPDRIKDIPAAQWTPQQRALYEAAVPKIRSTTDQLVPIAKLATHRVMRELYEQMIAYGRAFVDAVPTYTPKDNDLIKIYTLALNTLVAMCAAIDYKSAQTCGPLAELGSPPERFAPVVDPANAAQFMPDGDPACGEWMDAAERYSADRREWFATNPDIPVSEWSPEQKMLNDQVAPAMKRWGSEISAITRDTGNATLRDLAQLAAGWHCRSRQCGSSLESKAIPSEGYAMVLSGVGPAVAAKVWIDAGSTGLGRRVPVHRLHIDLREATPGGITSEVGDTVCAAVASAWRPATLTLTDTATNRLARHGGWKIGAGYRTWISSEVGTVSRVADGLTATELAGGTLISAPDDGPAEQVVAAMTETLAANGLDEVPH